MGATWMAVGLPERAVGRRPPSRFLTHPNYARLPTQSSSASGSQSKALSYGACAHSANPRREILQYRISGCLAASILSARKSKSPHYASFPRRLRCCEDSAYFWGIYALLRDRPEFKLRLKNRKTSWADRKAKNTGPRQKYPRIRPNTRCVVLPGRDPRTSWGVAPKI